MSQFQEWFFGEIVKYSESGLPQKIKKLENDIQTKNELIKRQKRNITDNGKKISHLEKYSDNLVEAIEKYDCGFFIETCKGYNCKAVKCSFNNGKITIGGTENMYGCEECDEIICEEHTEDCSDCGCALCDDCVTNCQPCGSSLCKSDILVCSYCDKILCDDCKYKCGGCDNIYCGDCLESCAQCYKDLCEECQIICNECDNIVCDYCHVKCSIDICESLCFKCEIYCDVCRNSVCSGHLNECEDGDGDCKKQMCNECVDRCVECNNVSCDTCIQHEEYGSVCNSCKEDFEEKVIYINDKNNK